MGSPFLLLAIGAVVMGGTSLSGGSGGPLNSIMGVLVIAILAIDVKFRKNRHRLLASTHLDPVAFEAPCVRGMQGLMGGGRGFPWAAAFCLTGEGEARTGAGGRRPFA